MSDLTKMGRVCVDWDGTLVDDERWPEMGDWLPYAPEAIHALAEIFEEVVIWTCRTASVGLDEVTPQDRMAQVEAIEKMLDDIEAPKHVGVWLGAHKPSAQFYIDTYVTDNNPGGEAIYRARFYVFTGRSGVKVFSATTADNGGGTEVIGVTFTGSAFQFAVNGAVVPDAAIPNAVGGGSNKWYSVELLYQASGAFQATVGGP